MRIVPLLIALLLPLTAVSAMAAETEDEGPQLLFTQSADAVSFDGNRLVLKGIGQGTFYFSDRPYRLTGFLKHKDFVDYWNKAGGTFEGDPPNAALMLVDEQEKEPLVFELMDATLEGQTLTYRVTLLEGDPERVKGPASLFIDRGGGGGHGGGGHGGGGGRGGGGDHGGGGEHGGGDSGHHGGRDWGGSWSNHEQDETTRYDSMRSSSHPYSSCNLSHLFGATSVCF